MLGLGLDLALGPKGGGFNPTSLFADGSLGQWIDPSDITTLYRDDIGTRVTADGQSLGVVVDKSKGQALGPELVNNGAFNSDLTGWTLGVDPLQVIATWVSGSAQLSRGTGGSNGFSQSIGSFVSGELLRVRFTVVSGVAACGGPFPSVGSLTGSVDLVVPAFNSSAAFRMWPTNPSTTCVIDNVSVMKIAGYHSQQATAANRPTYRTAPSRIDYDGVNDTLGTVFPDLGANCTIARSVPGTGAQILTGQTIAAGTRSDSTDHCGLIIINRALTASETAAVTSLLNTKAGL